MSEWNGPRIFAAALIVHLLSGCLILPKDGDAILAEHELASVDFSDGLAAFEGTLFPFLQANCRSCHGAAFATADVGESYSRIKSPQENLVDFLNPQESRLAVKSGDGHCGLPGCSNNASEARSLIEAWAQVENSLIDSGTGRGDDAGRMDPGEGSSGGAIGLPRGALVASPIPVPANLSTTYVPMRWNLDALAARNPLLAGAIFQVEIAEVSGSTYRVRNPRILGLRGAVRVSGVHLFVRPSTGSGLGVEDLGAGSVWCNYTLAGSCTWSAVAPASTLPNPLPATPIMNVPALDTNSMIIGIRSASDVLTLAINKVEASVATVASFSAIYSNILVARCESCHGLNRAADGVRYNNYAETLRTVVPGNPAASRLFTTINGPGATMPPGANKLSAAEVNAISSWITSGAPNN